jgi:hypothetical protein
MRGAASCPFSTPVENEKARRRSFALPVVISVRAL